jgi:hypothetical protein
MAERDVYVRGSVAHGGYRAVLISDDLRGFAANELGSIWAIELLVLLRADPGRAWSADELVRELRASAMVVGELLPRFRKLGLIESPEAGRWSWRPASADLERLSEAVARAYATRPIALIKAVAQQPNSQIHLLADAFKLKDGK